MIDRDEAFSAYEEFHKEFFGDVKTLNCGPICAACGDNCEVVSPEEEDDPYKYVCVFLPYELEFVASKMNIDLGEFRNRYAYGIRINGSVVDVLKFRNECPFLNSDFTCDMGETKIISCKIFPIIHYPLVEFTLSGHCDLVKNSEVKELFVKGIDEYKKLIDRLDYGFEYKYLRESLDILQLNSKKASLLLTSEKYEIIDVEEFKKLLMADPSHI